MAHYRRTIIQPRAASRTSFGRANECGPGAPRGKFDRIVRHRRYRRYRRYGSACRAGCTGARRRWPWPSLATTIVERHASVGLRGSRRSASRRASKSSAEASSGKRPDSSTFGFYGRRGRLALPRAVSGNCNLTRGSPCFHVASRMFWLASGDSWCSASSMAWTGRCNHLRISAS